MQMAPGKTQARKHPLTKSVNNNVTIKKSFMTSFYVFITNMIFHHRQQTNENQARELCTKCTFTRKKKNNNNNRKEKPEKFVFQMKKGKKEVFSMQTI